MYHPFYLFDEEPAAPNETSELNLNAGADRSVNFRRDFGTGLAKNFSFNDEVSCGVNLGSTRGADREEILITNSKAAGCSANLNSNLPKIPQI